MNHARTVPTSLAVLLAAALSIQAAVTVRLVDGQEKTADQVAMASQQFTLTAADGSVVGRWVVDDVARIDFDVADPAGEPPEAIGRVHVVGGVVRGTVQTFDGTAFTVATPAFGSVVLPIPCVRGVEFSQTAAAQVAAGGEPAADVVILTNMDCVSGTLNGIDAETVSFHSDLGDLKLERARVGGIRVAAPGGKRPPKAGPALRLTLVEGTAVELGDVAIAEGKLTGTFLGGPQVVTPVEKVRSIEVIGGRLVYLDTLEPASYEQQSLDILKWDIQRGKNVLGQPIRLRPAKDHEPRVFERGLGTHGPCRIVYQLGGKYERFIALVGIDESAGRWADANIVVKVDGKERYRADHVTWRQPARPVNLPVAKATRLELIVEAGEHFDVQDRIDWAEARLVRARGSH